MVGMPPALRMALIKWRLVDLRCGPAGSNHFHHSSSAAGRAWQCGFFRDIRYHSGHLHKPPLSDPNWPGSSGRQPGLDHYGSRAHWRAITQPNLAISRHASPRGGFLLHAPTGRHSLDSPASGMVNHDALHQLSGRRSSWVTSCRVNGGVVMKSPGRPKLYHDPGIFTARSSSRVMCVR